MWLLIMPKYSHEVSDILSPATFYIYLIHCLVIFETEKHLEIWQISSIPLRYLILCGTAYIISLAVSILIGVILYFSLLLVTKTLKEQDIRFMPKSDKIISVIGKFL